MSEFLRSWILSLTGASILSACAMAMTPEGPAKKAVKTVCGIVACLALISPVAEAELDSYDGVFRKYKEEAAAVSVEIDGINKKILRDIIESETEAYISDKGILLGLDIKSVRVDTQLREDGYYHPYSAVVTGHIDDYGKKQLGRYMLTELGIHEENIYWRNTDEN